MSRFKETIRLLAAFLCGWLFAFSDIIGHVLDYLLPYLQHSWNIYIGTVIPLLFLLLPLGLGIAAVLSVDRRNKYLFPLALLTGLLTLTGFYAYFLPGVIRSDAQPCDIYCRHGPIGRNETNLLVIFWLIDAILVFVSSLVSSLVIHFAMKHRRKEL